MNREEIKSHIPHREPMLLLDWAELLEDGTSHARFTIPEKPFFCEGHFPGNPIVPGVILCEIMAQSCFARLIDQKGNVYVCDAQLSVGGKRAAQARITVALVPQA